MRLQAFVVPHLGNEDVEKTIVVHVFHRYPARPTIVGVDIGFGCNVFEF